MTIPTEAPFSFNEDETQTILDLVRAYQRPLSSEIEAMAGLDNSTDMSPLRVFQAIGSYLQENGVANLSKFTFSAFGELRTAAPGNRSDIDFIYGKAPLLFDDLSANGGSATHNADLRAVVLATGGADAGRIGCMRQHAYIPYTAGNGQQIDLTGNLDYANLGGGEIAVFLRSNVTGSVVTTKKTKEAWLIDPDDPNDPIYWNKSQIYSFQFQSLKVGTIAFGLVRDGDFVPLYEWHNDNRNPGPYWQMPSLPPYWKIYNTADETIVEIGYGDDYNGIGYMYTFPTVQATAQALAICETVKSQGGQALFEMAGIPFVTPAMAAATTVNTLIPVLSIRVASLFNSLPNRALVFPTSFIIQTDNPIEYSILYRPALTNANFQAVNATYNGLEYDVSATALTGGYEIDGGPLSSGINQIARANNLLQKIPMALGNTGTTDILTIAAKKTGATNAAVRVRISGSEIRQ